MTDKADTTDQWWPSVPGAVGYCVTHHYACDCREAHFRHMEHQNRRLRSALQKIAAMPNSGLAVAFAQKALQDV